MSEEDKNEEVVDETTEVPSEEPTLEQKCSEYEQGWKRALADYENLQRDLAKVKEENRRQIRVSVAQELLPVMDNFQQAVMHAPDVKEIEAWLQGVLFIKKQFEDVFASMNITPIETVGKTFDPNLHEAVEERTEDGKAAGEILEEKMQGWMMGDVLLRPAKVIINKA